MNHHELLTALGEDVDVAGELGVVMTTVWRWHRGGIPPERWRDIIKLARKRGIAVTIDDLAIDSPRLKQRA